MMISRSRPRRAYPRRFPKAKRSSGRADPPPVPETAGPLPALIGVDFSSAPSRRKPVVLALGRLQAGVLQLQDLQTFDTLPARSRLNSPTIALIDNDRADISFVCQIIHGQPVIQCQLLQLLLLH